MEFRLLKADEIDVRIGNKIGEKGYSLLLYKDARCDMTILDETVGVENWQRKHYEVKDNMYCSVGINIYYNKEKEPYFIWKDDCGVESNTEKEKGEASDSFKRACVNWGIGRELYTSPRIVIWKPLTDEEKYRKFKVLDIGYTNRQISKLVIADYKTGEVIFNFNPEQDAKEIQNTLEENKKTQEEEFKKAEQENKPSEIVCSNCGEKLTEKVADFSQKKYGKPLCFKCQKADFKSKSFGG